ncbi:MAG: hypothetical protein DMG97_01755 [Acidobacteria bacterium]|nr:MAG: hypothetical protein DMG98_01245 [Acidobacteriota bacterium]PYV66282.1 MAG: hypothetical protein DMG96_42820 [Acidobacteriota bacterium]PYV77441.1 MAG: hypothetical protein DMG97_01755 [Acidobacteriota bacterium]
MHLQWLTQHGIPFTLIVEYIPLLATVTTTILSIVLARATLRYAEASDKSLALAREEFERQWSPELHIKLERISSRQTKIVVTNLGKISVLLQMVQLRQLSMAVPSLRSLLNEPLVGGYTWTDELGQHLFACTGDDYEGQIAASVTFYASGRMYRTDWFRFQIQVRHGEVHQLNPVNIAARRVQTLDDDENLQQELSEDVVKAKAAHA